MKTIRNIIRDLLRPNEPGSATATEPPAEESETNIINQNQNQHETESDESVGDSQLDNSDAGENSRISEENLPDSRPESDQDGGNSGDSRSGNVEPDSEYSEKPVDFEAALEEAYRRGVTDGRNSVIEEKLFPKVDDGIPHFRGMPPKPVSSPDIFSLAREA